VQGGAEKGEGQSGARWRVMFGGWLAGSVAGWQACGMGMPVGMRACVLMRPTDLPVRLSAPLPARSRTQSGKSLSRSCGTRRRRAACSTATTAAAACRRPPLQQPRLLPMRCPMPTQCMPTICSRWVWEEKYSNRRQAGQLACCLWQKGGAPPTVVQAAVRLCMPAAGIVFASSQLC
jgi:hypothetical protein